MPELTSSRILIAASPAQVMAVVADLAAYPQWNEEMRSVEVLTTEPSGRPQRVRFVLDASPIKDTYTLDYRWDDDRAVHWTLVEAQLLAGMDGSYQLTGNADGTTDVTYALAVELTIPMIGLLKRKGERVIVDRALAGLKKRVEAA